MLVAVTAAGVMALTGCGDRDSSSAYEDARAERSAAAAEESEAAEAAAEAAAERRKAQRDKCERQTGQLQAALEQIDSRLAVGMDYDEYGERLGDVRVAYDRVPIKRLEPSCIRAAGIHLERAFNAYNKVLGTWGDCIEDYYCDFSEGAANRTAQTQWAKAETSISKANSGLRKMGAAGESS
jgi:hypothetical protein